MGSFAAKAKWLWKQATPGKEIRKLTLYLVNPHASKFLNISRRVFRGSGSTGLDDAEGHVGQSPANDEISRIIGFLTGNLGQSHDRDWRFIFFSWQEPAWLLITFIYFIIHNDFRYPIMPRDSKEFRDSSISNRYRVAWTVRIFKLWGVSQVGLTCYKSWHLLLNLRIIHQCKRWPYGSISWELYKTKSVYEG